MTSYQNRLLSIAIACSTSLFATGALALTGNPSVNQVGYLPNSAKVAVLRSSATTPLTWELHQNGNLVATGSTTPKGLDAASGDKVHHIDFSNVNAEGSGFTLHVGGDQSYTFKIAPNAFKGALYDSIKYFYHNRSGIAIETQYTGGGHSSFPSNSKWARPAGHLNQGRNQGDYAVPCWVGSGCNYTLDVTKGWYDAGDHGKYVVNGGISVWKLLNLYERSLYISNTSEKYDDGMLNIPESGNGVPDILDEARWEMEFLIAMQVPEGETKAGMVHHKVHDVGWTGLPLAPHEDGQARALVPPTVTATLNLAATGAQCARLFADIDSGFADACLDAAERAWDAAQKNPNSLYSGNYDNGGGGYGDKDASDEFFWAAAELYITTGDSKYLSTINNRAIDRTDWAWPDTDIPGLMSLAIVPTQHTSSLQTSARAKLIQIADYHLSVINSTGYMLPSLPKEYYWGSNNVVANKMAVLGLANDFTGKDIYGKAFSKGLDYLFGNNSLSFSFVTGHGANSLKQPHHRFWAGALNSNYPWAPPGALSGGPNSGLEDGAAQSALKGCVLTPAKCFIDSIDSWSTNEITINWNGALAWVLAYYDDYSGGPITATPTPTVAPTATPTPVATPTPITTPVPTPVNSSDITCKVTNVNNWGNSYQMNVNVTNNGDTSINGWNITLDFGEAPQVTGSWNVSLSTSGNIVHASNIGWNGNLSPGKSTSFGLQGNHDGSLKTPVCKGQIIATDPTATPAPTPTSRPSVTPTATPTPKPTAFPSPTTTATPTSAPSGGNCKFVISDNWGSGFTGQIIIANSGTSAINGWEISWAFSDATRITSSWNANVSGSNPYSASNLGWNGNIPPGQSVSFGFQGTTNGQFTAPTVTGNVCN